MKMFILLKLYSDNVKRTIIKQKKCNIRKGNFCCDRASFFLFRLAGIILLPQLVILPFQNWWKLDIAPFFCGLFICNRRSNILRYTIYESISLILKVVILSWGLFHLTGPVCFPPPCSPASAIYLLRTVTKTAWRRGSQQAKGLLYKKIIF